MKRRLAIFGSYVFASMGFALLSLGLLLGGQNRAVANTLPVPGECVTTSTACNAGTCTTAASDCIAPATTCKCNDQ